jgi:hypothetical protein
MSDNLFIPAKLSSHGQAVFSRKIHPHIQHYNRPLFLGLLVAEPP